MTVIMSKEIFIVEDLIDFILRESLTNIFILENYTTTINDNDLVRKKREAQVPSLFYI